MRSYLFSISAFVVAIALVAPPAGAQVTAEDSVTGTATFGVGAQIGFDAHSGPSGENPSGSVKLAQR